MRKFFSVKIIVFVLIFILGAFLNLSKGISDHTVNVKGSSYRTPQIYISNSANGYSAGGVISLSSTGEPAVQIGGYNTSGKASILLYQSNEDALLDYIAHDKEGKRLKEKPDPSKIRYITTIEKQIQSGNEGTKVLLPLSEKGIWYVNVKLGSVSVDAFIVRSKIASVVREGDGEFIFWGQDFETKRSLKEGLVLLYDLTDSRRELARTPFDSDGIAKIPLSSNADVALIAQNDERAIVPINLKYIHREVSEYRYFKEKSKLTRYFIFTDKPLYKPGDTVHFKAILRDDDDARYSIPKGSATIKIYNQYYYQGSETKPIYEVASEISSDGTLSGSYKIPDSASVGGYSLYVELPEVSTVRAYPWYEEYSANSTFFDVQYYKKPESFLDVTTDQTILTSKDKASFKIKGSYFSGQPLARQQIKYSVRSTAFQEYEYWSELKSDKKVDDRYGYYGNHEVDSGIVELNKNGEADVSFDTNLSFANGRTQVFEINATLEDGSQAPAFSRKNILVHAGEFGIFRKEIAQTVKTGSVLSLPVILDPVRDGVNVSEIELKAKIHRENWVSYQETDKKYPSYRKEEENLPDLLNVKTDKNGDASLSFTPTKVGLYKITVETKDSKGNFISKDFYSYVNSEEFAYNPNGASDLLIEKDKEKYNPTDTAKLNIYSYVPSRDVLLTLERGRVDRYQVVHLSGKSASVNMPLVDTDIPNIYAQVTSFDDNSLNSNSVSIPVSAEGKKLKTHLKPNSNSYGPSETVTLDIKTTDNKGNPVSSDVAIRVIDKAIYELRDDTTSDIFYTFWHERNNSTSLAHSLEGITVAQGGQGGGCFVAGAKILMNDNRLKNIEDIKKGDYVLTRNSETDPKLVKAKVTGIHKAEEGGYLIINSNLKVTSNHIVFVNGEWDEAGSIQIGDFLTNTKGELIRVESVEWQRQKVSVYNLEIEKNHTFFADGVWVHNQKGDPRDDFKDTAYWNPSIKTNDDGTARVSFKLPDNLTTWVIAAISSTNNTQVGNSSTEIVVKKDIVVRPILPNIFRTDDQVVLSSLVHNFTDSDHNFDINFEFDSGKVDEPDKKDQEIKAGDLMEVFWKTKVNKENDKAKLTFSAVSKENKKLSDTIIQQIPVRPFGYEENSSQTGEGNKTYDIKFFNDSSKGKSQITLSMSPTIAGTLPTAMKYLINYPYGCTEQTTSRFVPAVIAKSNPLLFSDALSEVDIDENIQKGVSRLASLQRQDGGWTWWYQGKSSPFVTAYVVEYLLKAREQGADVDENLLSRAKEYLQRDNAYNTKTSREEGISKEEKIAKNYGLTLLGTDRLIEVVTGLENLSPDVLSLAVMTKYLNGDKDPKSNGLERLEDMAIKQGNVVYWAAGESENFGSPDASTAMAIRAISIAGGDTELAAKGVEYLMRERKYEYWSNTYATAQVVQAVVDFSKYSNESSANYNYTVTLDGKSIAKGSVGSSTQKIQDIQIPLNELKPSSKLSVSKSGNGRIYSTVVVNQFRTDRRAKPVSKGIGIKREYINLKGDEYTMGVGDTVLVRLTVDGPTFEQYYGVIKDELPSGMVPVNDTFKNEEFNQSYDYTYDISSKEITENGVVLSVYKFAPGQRVFTYKARVVSEGRFLTPPAIAGLMYSPETYARSAAQVVTIDPESKLIPQKALKKTLVKVADLTPTIIFFALVFVGLIFVLIRKEHIIVVKAKELFGKLFKRKTPPPA